MAIEKIISNLVVDSQNMAVADLLRRSLTLDDRIQPEDMLAPLTSAERYAVSRLFSEPRKLTVEGQLSMAFRPHGRLYLLDRDTFSAYSDSLILLGHVDFSHEELSAFRALRASDREALEREKSVVIAYLLRHGIDSVCGELRSSFLHMAPLIYYIGDCCISNFYNVGKSGFELEFTLTHALNQVSELRENAPPEFLMLTYCLHLLSRSGTYTRFEELNSTQLSSDSLNEFFDDKYDFYRMVSESFYDKTGSSASFFLNTLEEKAISLSHMRGAVGSKCRFIRQINGVNLRKKESVLPISPIQANALLAPVYRSASTMAVLQRWVGARESALQAFRPESFGALLHQSDFPEDATFSSRLEALINHVVKEAIHSTRSDFGMTRGVRKFLEFVNALRAADNESVCAWGQDEYFCHVVPSEQMKQDHPPKMLSMILNAISGRMRFNSWHYAPSYLKLDHSVGDRGWFHAPQMADVADWSDQHHEGHVHAMVRYSIRSPMPVCADATVLAGFIDLRLMRQSGDPYTREDLLTAISYTEVLQFIYQNLMNHLLRQGLNFSFSFGNRLWFDRSYAPRAPEIVATVS